ncbi:hypothetical protein ABTB70_19835, partial [Acinetobacter baumannii]
MAKVQFSSVDWRGSRPSGCGWLRCRASSIWFCRSRAPARVEATDARGNYVTLVFFGGNSGWAKTQL